jgi:chromosome segregation ATPase
MTTNDGTDDGKGGGRRETSGRTSAAQKQRELEEERQQLKEAQQRLSMLEDELGQRLEQASRAISVLEEELEQSRAREEGYRSRMERVEALYDADRQKYESLMREVLLSSALDGLSTSLQNLDSTLGAKLAPLAVLNTLTSAGAEVTAVDVGRFQEVQGTTARFDSNSYVVRRATIVEPSPPPGSPSAPTTSVTAS